MDVDLKALFLERYKNIDEGSILMLAKKGFDGALNNVVNGLAKECFGLIITDKNNLENYDLVHIIDNGKLEGEVLRLSPHLKYRDDILLFFCHFLAHNYPKLDPIDVFNTYQNQTRSYLESLDYFTLTTEETKDDKSYNPMLIVPNRKGVIFLKMINKVDAYREYFSFKERSDFQQGKNFVYLMHNKINSHTKIGTSQKPVFREKTLQAQEPEVELIAYWNAPPEQEKVLHRIFIQKRIRGEWFNLKTEDFKTIKEIMKPFEKF